MRNFNQLKKLVSVPAILDWYGLTQQLNRKQGGYVGTCPIHKGNNKRAFHINERGLWFCFTKCNEGGDIIDFIKAMEGGGYDRVAPVLKTLVHHLPHSVSFAEENISPPVKKASDRTNHKKFVPFTRHLTLSHEHPEFNQRGLKRETLRAFDAGYWPKEGFLLNCLAVRVHNRIGQPLSYIGRRLNRVEENKWGKWKMPPNFPKHSILYNYHRAQPYMKKEVIIVEGPWDVMKLWQAGFKNAVALLGVSISQNQMELLKRNKHIILFLDGDDTGISAAKKLQKKLGPDRTSIYQIPAGYDPASMTEDDIRKRLAPFSSNQY